MRDFAIMTDSCCDLASAMAEELDLSVLPLKKYEKRKGSKGFSSPLPPFAA